MLKQSLFAIPRFYRWILVWTIISWLFYMPARMVGGVLFSNLELNLKELVPGNQNLLLLLYDKLYHQSAGFQALFLLGIVCTLFVLFLNLGVIPQLCNSVSLKKPSVREILAAWPYHFPHMAWRFLAWLFISALLIGAVAFSAFKSVGLNATVKLVVIVWIFMLSWWTHTMVLWGMGEKACLRKGLVRLFTRIHALLLGFVLFAVFAGIAMAFQYSQLKMTINPDVPLMAAILVFILGWIFLYCAKFLWISSHCEVLVQPSGQEASPVVEPVEEFKADSVEGLELSSVENEDDIPFEGSENASVEDSVEEPVEDPEVDPFSDPTEVSLDDPGEPPESGEPPIRR